MVELSDIVILRCCRDWPCHATEAYGFGGKCGLCRKSPVAVAELYPLPEGARNWRTSPDSSMDRAPDF